MRVFINTRVAEEVKEHGTAHGLIEALFTDRWLQLDYDAGYTRNAAEAFDAHVGNCLSLAILTGALAKELGLEVRYQSVLICASVSSVESGSSLVDEAGSTMLCCAREQPTRAGGSTG
jgi:hypothetical protein